MRDEMVQYVEKRLRARMMDRFVKSQTRVVIPDHQDYIRIHSANTYANIIKQFFTNAFVNRHNCVECGVRGKNERCHSINAPRPFILLKALHNVSPKVGHRAVPVLESDIIVEFIKLHAKYGLTFLCNDCHRAQKPKTGV